MWAQERAFLSNGLLHAVLKFRKRWPISGGRDESPPHTPPPTRRTTMPSPHSFNSFNPPRRAGKSAAQPMPIPAALEPTDAELLLHRARNAAYAEAAQGRLGRGL